MLRYLLMLCASIQVGLTGDPCKEECDPNQICVVQDGQPVCQFKTRLCSAWGDSHYRTLDGRTFEFHGTCTYTFAQVPCRTSSNSSAPVEVQITRATVAGNEPQAPVNSSAPISRVLVLVQDFNIAFVKGEQQRVWVNGLKHRLPYYLSSMLRLYPLGSSVVLETGVGLMLRYDWLHHLQLRLSHELASSACGLCGGSGPRAVHNLPALGENGTAAERAEATVKFARSWKTGSDDDLCSDECGACPHCGRAERDGTPGVEVCSLLRDPDGPFANCLVNYDPVPYVRSCRADLCAQKGRRKVACRALKAYADDCEVSGFKISPWRELANCSVTCPVNSHYKTCGTLCPATCADPDAPSRCQSGCAEACQCKQGFLLSGQDCVPPARCGCTHQGGYRLQNETFWAEKCQQRCACDPATRNVTCVPAHCEHDEKCALSVGVRGCRQGTHGLCLARGDPHYTTFDGRRFDFDGNCMYLLAAHCPSRGPLPDFKIEVQNERTGATESFSKMLKVRLRGYEIKVSWEVEDRVLVNGLSLGLPTVLSFGKVKIYKTGLSLYVESDFGLILTYNWNNLVTLALPRNFSGATCGICGNFNGDRTDDLVPPTAPDVDSESLTRWKTSTVDGCTDVVAHDRPLCPKAMRSRLSKGNSCGMLTEPEGPFRDCHETVDPLDSFDNCVSDVCLNNGSLSVLCQILGGYAAACQDAGAEVHSWRSSKFCPMSCPANTKYALCSSPSLNTCTEPPSPHGTLCQEGCECVPGFFRSGGKCVRESACGCLHGGVYRESGVAFFPDEHCAEECVCLGRAGVQCKNVTCPAGTQCGVRNATRGCYLAPGSGKCSLSGGVHLSTFDGHRFDFRGTCGYALSQTCNSSGANDSVAAFSLHFQRGQLHLQINETNLTLASGQRGKVKVNGVLWKLPVQLGRLRVLQLGLRVQVEADAGLVLAYDLQNFAELTVPHGYAGRLCGLCGDFDSDPSNDLRLRSGNLTSNLTALGASWKVPGLDTDCRDGCAGGCPECNVTEAAQFRTEERCGLLSDPAGPFGACLSVVDPWPYVENCVFDLCVSHGARKKLCSNLQAYTLACHSAGAPAEAWRNETFCPLECPPNSEYAVSVDPCAATCSNVSRHACQASRAEGCVCHPGFQLSVDRCVTAADCGCFQDGHYYELGEASWTEGCKKRCDCPTPGPLRCESAACPAGWRCGLLNGSPECVKGERPGVCLPGAPCPSNATRTVASCWVLGGSYFYSFDGAIFNFLGNCTYILAESCGEGASSPAFSVLIEKSQDRFSGLKTVVVDLSEDHIVLKPGSTSIWVNGGKKHLPVTLPQASVHQSGLFVVMNTTFGLSVRYNRAQYVQVDLPKNFSSVCGLCGNNNGDVADDLRSPEGAVADEVAFGWSWRVEEGDASCSADCVGCSAEEEGLQLDEETQPDVSLSVFLWSESSPFMRCHVVVDPSAYDKLCARHHCVKQWDLAFLCEALQSYSIACQSASVQIRGWRNSSFCSAQCPKNSHYEVCGSACPATCGAPAPSPCSLPCVETCQCDEGFLPELDACVPAASCGCLHQGSYHRRDQPFWADEACTERCVCDGPGEPARCTPSSCGPLASCGVRKGERACLPYRLGYCVLESGRYFRTFDGRAYDFQGSCAYRMVGLCSAAARLAPFEVQARNAGDAEAALKVEVKVYNVTIEISSQNDGQVKVDGLRRNLPFSLDGGKVTVHATGLRTFLHVDFGLSVALYASGRLSLALSSKYAGATCGLCGNYNGDPVDDMTGRSGQKALSPSEMARSWNSGALPWCVAGCTGDCPTCTPKQREEFSGPAACGRLLNATGPFRVCHGKVEPGRFYNNCLSDLCSHEGAPSSLCRSLGNYVAACQEANVKIYAWRSPGFCEQPCPQDTVYELCPILPNNTCEGPPVSNDTLSPPGVCYENCICPDGLLRSGSLCVEPGSCGCVHQGEYLQVGAALLTCRERCVCKAGGVLACHPVFCTEEEECRVRDGLWGCYPRTRFGRCSLAGRSHYRTFDQNDFHFTGTCNYTLSESCAPPNASLGVVPFAVTLLNGELDQQSVRVEAYGLKLILSPKHPNKVLAGEVLENLPFSVANMTVYRQGLFLAVQALNSVQVIFDLRNHVVVRLPESYKNRTCGLCGNYNGSPADDVWLPNATAGGAAKRPAEGGWACRDGCGDNCPLCVSLLPRYSSNHHCGQIIAPTRAFNACHPVVDPAGYYSNCMYDLCVSEGQPEQLCDWLQAYAVACREAGVEIVPWRNDSQCMFQCPQFSHYSPCANACWSVCAEVQHTVLCPAGCAEGCQCDTDFYFDGDGCVPLEDCGCFLDGRRYKPGEGRLLQNCTQNCTCGPPVVCEPYACPESQACGVIDGVMTCHFTDPCEGRCGTYETCVRRTEGPVCDPPVLDLCWAWGDPHFHSFPGVDFDFDGSCSYILAASTGVPGGLSPFIITEKHERRHSSWTSSVRDVHVNVYGYMVSMHRLEKGYVRVNGLRSHLPVSLRDRIRVDYWGDLLILQTDFGLQVVYDWAALVLVGLHPMYRGTVYGLCAYEGGPSGVVEWAKLHAISDGDRLCCTDCKLPPPNITAEEQQHSRERCAVLQEPTGPFALCSKEVGTDPFLQGCVNDLSASAGAQEVLAKALKSYSTICQYHGFSFKDPGDLYHDEIDPCGPHGELMACASLCQPSCDQFTSPACGKPCARGCVCDAGYVSINQTCSPPAECGCLDAIGQLRGLNETFWSPENCEDRCTCDPLTRSISCVQVRCPTGQTCRLLDGVRGCYPADPVNCTLMGGLHFHAFNGHAFDFRCGYTYSLVKAPPHASSLVPFDICIGNASSGARFFLNLDLRVQVYEKDLVIAKEAPYRLMVDGLYTPLPYSFNKGQILVYHSPSSIRIQTDFGLQVALYRSGTITVVVPAWYSSVLQGLCGKPSDPKGVFVTRTGQTNDIQEFANSWRTVAVGQPLDVTLKPCSKAERDVFKDFHFCQVLLDEQGPFKECNGVLDPQLYYDGCLADTCAHGGHPTALCNSISDYATACQAANLTVREWRRDTFCGVDCPANSHYELCGPSCLDTCWNSVNSATCSAPCQEGCQCDSGHALSDGRCVPLSDCGCLYKGLYYPRGSFILGGQCQQRCLCGEGSKMVCSSFNCGDQEACVVEGGIGKCVPANPSMCQVLGGFGYITFDGYALAHHGICTYVLAQSNPSTKPHFKVLVSVERVETATDDPLKSVVLILDNNDVVEIFPRILWKVKYNKEYFALPMKKRAIKAYQDGGSSVLETDFGLQIRFTSTLYIQVIVPPRYSGAVAGLCGNCNGKAADDLKLRSGQLAGSPSAFVKSWAVEGASQHCALDCTANCQPFNVSDAKKHGDEPCDLLTSAKGPFQGCTDTVDVEPYHSACVQARTATSRKQEALCVSLEAYAAVCRVAGVEVDTWRGKTCRLECPDQSHASSDVDSCSGTCAEILTPGACVRRSEGCQCNGSLVFNGDSCVPVSQCGCVHRGRYIKNKEFLYAPGCSKKCWCELLGGAACEATACAPEQRCLLRYGAWGCHSDVGVCQVHPDLSFRTLDGLESSLQSNVSYNLASLCDWDSDRWFQVVHFQGYCEGNLVHALHLFLHGVTMVIQNGRVHVHGDLVSLPVSLSSGVSVSRIWAWPEAWVVVRKDSGTDSQPDLELKASTSGTVRVKPSSVDSGKLCGACGNYNGQASDDLPESKDWIMSINGCGSKAPRISEEKLADLL